MGQSAYRVKKFCNSHPTSTCVLGMATVSATSITLLITSERELRECKQSKLNCEIKNKNMMDKNVPYR